MVWYSHLFQNFPQFIVIHTVKGFGISDKIDLKIKNIIRDKEGRRIKIMGSTQEKDIAIVNIYAPNIGAPQYIRQTLTDIKGEINSNTIIVGDFNTPFTPMDR